MKKGMYICVVLLAIATLFAQHCAYCNKEEELKKSLDRNQAELDYHKFFIKAISSNLRHPPIIMATDVESCEYTSIDSSIELDQASLEELHYRNCPAGFRENFFTAFWEVGAHESSVAEIFTPGTCLRINIRGKPIAYIVLSRDWNSYVFFGGGEMQSIKSFCVSPAIAKFKID